MTEQLNEALARVARPFARISEACARVMAPFRRIEERLAAGWPRVIQTKKEG